MTALQESIDTFQLLDPKGFLQKFTDDNVRPDGRPLHAARPTTVVKGVLPRNSYGSALVRIGETQVLAAITILVGSPGAGSPEHGDVEVRLSVGPLCSGRYDLSGRVIQTESASSEGGGGSLSDPEAVESFVQRTIRSSEALDLAQLSIERGRSAWRIRVGLLVLNHDGNLEDSCLLAAVASLSDLKLPRTKVEEDGVVKIVPGPNPEICAEGGVKLQLRNVPLPLTVGVFDGKMLVDLTAQEEEICRGSVTAVVTTGEVVVGLTKLGAARLTATELAACVTLAFGRAKELEEVVLAEQVLTP